MQSNEADTFTERLNILVDEKLKERNNKGITYRKTMIAKEINISPNQLNNYLNGSQLPGLEILVSIIKYFDVSFDWMIGKTDERNPQHAHAEKEYGLTLKASERLIEINKGVSPASLFYVHEGINPVLFGTTGRDVYEAYFDDQKFDARRLFDGMSDDEITRRVSKLELEVLNKMIVEWDLISDITMYLYSTPFDIQRRLFEKNREWLKSDKNKYVNFSKQQEKITSEMMMYVVIQRLQEMKKQLGVDRRVEQREHGYFKEVFEDARKDN